MMTRDSVRKKKGLTQAALSARVGISRNMVSKFEKGRSGLAVETLHAWCVTCDATPAEMAAMLELGAGAEVSPAVVAALAAEKKAA